MMIACFCEWDSQILVGSRYQLRTFFRSSKSPAKKNKISREMHCNNILEVKLLLNIPHRQTCDCFTLSRCIDTRIYLKRKKVFNYAIVLIAFVVSYDNCCMLNMLLNAKHCNSNQFNLSMYHIPLGRELSQLSTASFLLLLSPVNEHNPEVAVSVVVSHMDQKETLEGQW